MLICNEKRYMFRKIDGNYLLLDLETGNGHLLDNIGSIMFEAIIKYDVEEAVSYLLSNFTDVQKEQLIYDVNEFILNMIEKGVLFENDK